MNTHQSAGWSGEVKSSQVPFKDGKPTDLHILVLHNEYQITVNWEFSFAHQIQPSSVKTIQMWRAVLLTSVHVI
jgi:hypothetical protein